MSHKLEVTTSVNQTTLDIPYHLFATPCRSNDGRILVVSSSDGYCTLVHFHDGELGKAHNLSGKDVLSRRSFSPSLHINTDMPGN